MAYSAQSYYHPGVLPDTQGMAPGIQGATGAIAGALGTYAGWKRDDTVRADQQQFATQRDEARMAHESGLVDKRSQRDMQMFGMEQDARKQERELEKAMADEQLRSANAGKAAFLMQSGYDATAVQAASKMSPKAAAEFLDAGMSQAGMELRARMEAEQARTKAAEARKSYPLLDPSTGKAEAGYFMTGNGQVVPRGAAQPQPFSPEELQKMGLAPSSAKVGNVTFGRSKTAPKPSEIRTVADPSTGQRTTVMWDEAKAQWMPWNPPMAPGATSSAPDPANAIKSVLSTRQK